MKPILFTLLVWMALCPARAADVVALCMGNDEYPGEDALDTPVADALLMQKTLQGLPGSVQVVPLHNGTYESMHATLDEFVAAAQGAKLALVFYSGHGLEDQPTAVSRPDTYLLPIDKKIESASQLVTRTLALSTVLRKLGETGAEAKVVILDCCRNHPVGAARPLLASSKAGDLDSRVKSLLGQAARPEGTLIAFSTSPGRKAAAFISNQDANSPFTAFLSAKLGQPGLSLRDAIEQASDETIKATERRQIPYLAYDGASTIFRELVLVPWLGEGSGSLSVMARPSPAIPVIPLAPTSVPSGPGSATKERPFVNSLGQRYVPALTYKDGTKVLFSIWETRRQDYEAYAKGNGGVDSNWKAVERGGQPVGHEPTHPVVSVSWEDATSFCKWLTQREREAGRIGSKDEYRLPRDLEWSYAVGIGPKEDANASPEDKSEKIDGVYPWGTGYPPPVNSGNYADNSAKAKFSTWMTVIEGYRDGYATTAPVGSYQANDLGIYDLGGNVREWCLDKYNNESESRVLRGGSWYGDDPSTLYFVSFYLLSSQRDFGGPFDRSSINGFRCVLVVSGG